MNNKSNDMVNHPSHYNRNGIECFDVIKAFYGMEAFEHFCLGSALKYTMRCKNKGKYVEDLKKARVFISEIIKLKEDAENMATTHDNPACDIDAH